MPAGASRCAKPSGAKQPYLTVAHGRAGPASYAWKHDVGAVGTNGWGVCSAVNLDKESIRIGGYAKSTGVGSRQITNFIEERAEDLIG